MTHTFKELALNKKILTAEDAKHISDWERRAQIDEWYWNGLISVEQQEKMYALAGFLTPPSVKRPINIAQSKPFDWLHSFILVAVICIVGGCVALIAANWHAIPAWVKLMTYFAVSFSLAMSLFKRFERVQERTILSLANIGWAYAGIALIGQVFHLNGSLGSAVAFGAVLSFPFICAASFQWRFVVWLLVFAGGLLTGPMSAYLLPALFGLLPLAWWRRDEVALSTTWLVLLLVSVLFQPWVGQFWYLWNNLMPTAILWVVLSSMFLMSTAFMALFGKDKPLSQGFQNLYTGVAVGLVVASDVLYSFGLVSPVRLSASLEWIVCTAFLPVLAIALLPRKMWRVEGGAWLFFALFAVFFAFLPFKICGMILTCLILLSAAFCAAVKGAVSEFNACLALLLIRVGVAYIDVLISFASTGLGLISLGLLILAGIWLYKRLFNGFWVYIQKGDFQ